MRSSTERGRAAGPALKLMARLSAGAVVLTWRRPFDGICGASEAGRLRIGPLYRITEQEPWRVAGRAGRRPTGCDCEPEAPTPPKRRGETQGLGLRSGRNVVDSGVVTGTSGGGKAVS